MGRSGDIGYQEYLSDVMNDPVKSRFCRQKLLCRSLGDNCVYSITITSPCDNAEEVKVSEISTKIPFIYKWIYGILKMLRY